MHPHVDFPAPSRPDPALPLHEPAPRPEPLQVTIGEAARLLAYDARTVRRLNVCGELRAVGRGRLRRVPMQSLRDYQQRHLTGE